jgi:GNAT superfamily N-acetyltransferase
MVADARLVAAIDQAAQARRDPRDAALARELLALGKSWIAEADGAAAGYALVSRGFFRRPFVELLMVAPDWRRRGVGGVLLERCERACDDDRLFTSTNTSNAPMRALLHSLGWTPSGEIDNLDPGDPELVFVKLKSSGRRDLLSPPA